MHSPDQQPASRVLPGTLYMLILQTLSRKGPLHGYGIAKAIQARSDDVLRVEEGSLYPALQRMAVKGWLEGEWQTSDGGRRARYYRLKPKGEEQLAREVAEFERVVRATRRVLQPA